LNIICLGWTGMCMRLSESRPRRDIEACRDIYWDEWWNWKWQNFIWII